MLGILGLGREATLLSCTVLAIVALVLGIRGLRAVRINPSLHGTAHAWIGLVCGSIGLLLNLLIIIVAIVAFVANAGG